MYGAFFPLITNVRRPFFPLTYQCKGHYFPTDPQCKGFFPLPPMKANLLTDPNVGTFFYTDTECNGDIL
ncbi:unnamed protein product, partial [Staurois parvus]